MTLLWEAVVACVGSVYGLHHWDEELYEMAPTFERRPGRWVVKSTPYKRVVTITICVHLISIFSILLAIVNEKMIGSWTLDIICTVGQLFFFLNFLIIIPVMGYTNRKAKKWRRLTRGRKRLSQSERLEIERLMKEK